MSDDLTPQEARAELADAMERYDISVLLEYQPDRDAYSKKTGDLCLRWAYTLCIRGGSRHTGTYTQGLASCPAYPKTWVTSGLSERDARRVRLEISTGLCADPPRERLPPPAQVDVLGSLLQELGALDHANFESWADEYGYDSDSRKAEAVYRACLATALVFRAHLGDTITRELYALAVQL